MTCGEFGPIGQLLGGIGALIIALVAVVTLIIISFHQKNKLWVDDLRALYAEFWNDTEVGQVRRWIVSDRLYKDVLRPVLILRSEGRDLNEGASIILDNVDKFISLLIRLKIYEKKVIKSRRWSLSRRGH